MLVQIVLRTEASFHEGLSAALFQKTSKGIQPVHYINRTITETEKRYSQTEKDAMAIPWAKKRFHTYLQGAPKFQIITAHKPLVTMFNKPTAKLPPCIEKWVMSMQDADYEVTYEPGKDERDPLDFMSRHPLPETGDDSTEKWIKTVIPKEHAVILDKVRAEVKKDQMSRTLTEAIMNEKWQNLKNDPSLTPYYAVKNELYLVEGTIVFRMDGIVIPEKLQRKVIKTAHSMQELCWQNLLNECVSLLVV